MLNYNKPTFGSLNNPIANFVIPTDRGDLFVSELSPEKCQDKRVARPLVEFFLKNIAANTDDPDFINILEPDSKDWYNRTVAKHMNDFIGKSLYDDGNMTVLEAKDRYGRLRAAVSSGGLTEFDMVNDNKTCYVENIAVDSKFRNQHVGKIMLGKTLNVSKEVFTDVFLVAEKNAEGFYKRIGFKNIKPDSAAKRFVVDELSTTRFDYPQYASFMSKVLDKDATRWWDRVFYNKFGFIKQFFR